MHPHTHMSTHMSTHMHTPVFVLELQEGRHRPVVQPWQEVEHKPTQGLCARRGGGGSATAPRSGGSSLHGTV